MTDRAKLLTNSLLAGPGFSEQRRFATPMRLAAQSTREHKQLQVQRDNHGAVAYRHRFIIIIINLFAKAGCQ